MVTGEFYHAYNHGVEDRDIILDNFDALRFLESMRVFNCVQPIGSIYEQSFVHENLLGGETAKSKLVNIVAYCINPNHFHLLLEQVSDNGISEFMKRLGGGYTWYYNNKHKRKGSLFRGVFRSSHISTDAYINHLSAYITLNDHVHQLGGETAKLVKSSWGEYIGKVTHPMCTKEIVLGQFKNKKEYKKYAEDSLSGMQDRKKIEREEKYLMID